MSSLFVPPRVIDISEQRAEFHMTASRDGYAFQVAFDWPADEPYVRLQVELDRGLRGYRSQLLLIL